MDQLPERAILRTNAGVRKGLLVMIVPWIIFSLYLILTAVHQGESIHFIAQISKDCAIVVASVFLTECLLLLSELLVQQRREELHEAMKRPMTFEFALTRIIIPAIALKTFIRM
jgi:hypothetical protein